MEAAHNQKNPVLNACTPGPRSSDTFLNDILTSRNMMSPQFDLSRSEPIHMYKKPRLNTTDELSSVTMEEPPFSFHNENPLSPSRFHTNTFFPSRHGTMPNLPIFDHGACYSQTYGENPNSAYNHHGKMLTEVPGHPYLYYDANHEVVKNLFHNYAASLNGNLNFE